MKHIHYKESSRHEQHAVQDEAGTPMSHPHDALELIKQPFYEMEKHARVVNERIRELLNGLSKEDMIDRINQLQLSDKSLNFLTEGIALEKGDYEISVAVEEIKKGRPVNLTDDPIDHMNYTAF